MNAVTKHEGGAIDAYNHGGNPFAAAAAEMGASAGTFLKFDGNTGRFTFGKDDDELDIGTLVAIDPASIRRGWICWKEEKVEDEIMIAVLSGSPPLESDLPDHGPYAPPEKDDEKGDGWSAQAAFDMVTDEGEVYTLKTMSKSGLRGVGNMLKDIGKQFRLHPGQVPLVELDHTSFDAKNKAGKKLGKKFAPLFKIVKWVDSDVLEGAVPAGSGDAPETDDEDDVANYAPPVEKTKPAAGKPEPAPEPPPPPPPKEEPKPEPAKEAPKPEEERAAPPSRRAGKRF